jgi:S1-C subfamily serine protease
MSRFILSFALWLSIAVATSIATISTSLATSPFETSGNVRWIIYASRQNIDEAIGLARRFGSEFGQPTVISTTNGWFAVTVGPLSVPDPVALKKKLSDSWSTPKDAFLSKGQTFIEKVWENPKSPVLAKASGSENAPHIASAAGLEVRVDSANNRNVVRVRVAGREVARVTFGDDDAPYTSAEASIARLDASSAFPQVVATHFTGGAHCCTDMKILTFVENRWEVVSVGQFDSDGPAIMDLNGDGSAELVGKDDSFDYAFASYAESYAPPKIFQLVGNKIKDVSNTPEFKKPILQMLLAEQGLASPDMWRDNGFLAGWVAHNAMLGSGADAWRKMLDLYNRNSDWDLSVCTVATKGYDPCPESEKRFRDFPTALRERLSKNGHNFADIIAAPTVVAGPSFDCNKARTQSEIEICRSPRLAELDNILASGYAFIKGAQGRPAADAIGIPYWKLIAQCEGDNGCIARRQSEEISALALAGAPVSLPAWASIPASPPTAQFTPPSAPVVAKASEEPSAPPKPQQAGSSGTGFFVTAEGVVLTNAHVVENCSAIRATTSQGATAAAKVIARDVRNDLALLGTGLALNRMAAFRITVRLGEAIEAFGYPLTDVLSKSGNFTLGNVSALVGIGEDSRYLQISAPAQPGNSGGPLLDQSGNLVGVVSAKLNALKLMLATNGDIPQNVNFAIKASIVTNFLDSNGVGYSTGGATQLMQPADLAEQAKAISVFIECE